MRILKNKDGSLWVFSESQHGWIRPTDKEVDPGKLLNELIKDETEDHKNLSFSEAFINVQKKYPEIAKHYFKKIRSNRGFDD